MVNTEKYEINPEYRQNLLKGKSFKFSEKETAEMKDKGLSEEDIVKKQEDVIARQELDHQEK
jgi:hypothetical protein